MLWTFQFENEVSVLDTSYWARWRCQKWWPTNIKLVFSYHGHLVVVLLLQYLAWKWSHFVRLRCQKLCLTKLESWRFSILLYLPIWSKKKVL